MPKSKPADTTQELDLLLDDSTTEEPSGESPAESEAPAEESPADTEAPAEEEVEEVAAIDVEEVTKQLKPDFADVVRMLGIVPTGNTIEEAVANMQELQGKFEAYLRDKIVKKVRANLQAQMSQSNKKPGNKVTTPAPRQRKTSPFV